MFGNSLNIFVVLLSGCTVSWLSQHSGQSSYFHFENHSYTAAAAAAAATTTTTFHHIGNITNHILQLFVYSGPCKPILKPRADTFKIQVSCIKDIDHQIHKICTARHAVLGCIHGGWVLLGAFMVLHKQLSSLYLTYDNWQIQLLQVKSGIASFTSTFKYSVRCTCNMFQIMQLVLHACAAFPLQGLQGCRDVCMQPSDHSEFHLPQLNFDDGCY